MDLDQHTRHVTEAVDEFSNTQKPRRFSDPVARQFAAAALVTRIRRLTEELLRDATSDLTRSTP